MKYPCCSHEMLGVKARVFYVWCPNCCTVTLSDSTPFRGRYDLEAEAQALLNRNNAYHNPEGVL